MSGSDLVVPAILGRYTLLERVGGGGMASVYRATFSVDGGFEKEVAVKVIRSELASDPVFTEMFQDEARISARLNHANLVQTFDFGQVGGTFFLAMEFVRGRTLANLLRACLTLRRPLGITRSVHLVGEVARALGFAHRLEGSDGSPLGLVHRDVSPQNVLISREGEVKLADFGIAKAAERTHVTQPGRIRGKCAYMSPEQARGLAVDARTDVFALGVVLWECLASRPLFDGPSDGAVLLQVIQREIAAPSRFDPEIPPELDELVLRMLARDPAERPRNGDDVARELAVLNLRLVQSFEQTDLSGFLRSLSSGTAAWPRVEGPPGEVKVGSAGQGIRAPGGMAMPPEAPREVLRGDSGERKVDVRARTTPSMVANPGDTVQSPAPPFDFEAETIVRIPVEANQPISAEAILPLPAATNLPIPDGTQGTPGVPAYMRESGWQGDAQEATTAKGRYVEGGSAFLPEPRVATAPPVRLPGRVRGLRGAIIATLTLVGCVGGTWWAVESRGTVGALHLPAVSDAAGDASSSGLPDERSPSLAEDGRAVAMQSEISSPSALQAPEATEGEESVGAGEPALDFAPSDAVPTSSVLAASAPAASSPAASAPAASGPAASSPAASSPAASSPAASSPAASSPAASSPAASAPAASAPAASAPAASAPAASAPAVSSPAAPPDKVPPRRNGDQRQAQPAKAPLAAKAVVPAKAAPPRAEPASGGAIATGTLILSSKMVGDVAVVIDGKQRVEIAPHVPIPISVPAGKRMLLFELGKNGMRCAIPADVEAAGRHPLQLQADGQVVRLNRDGRTPVPCGS